MSWSFSIPVTDKEEFGAAVDAAQATGQPADSIGLVEDVMAAKTAMKALALLIKRGKVGGSAGGHCLQPEEGDGWSDSINVNLYGTN